MIPEEKGRKTLRPIEGGRPRTEEPLQRPEERYRMIVGHAPIILFAINSQGIFTLSEGKGLEVLGLKPGEVVGQSVFKVYRDEPAILDNVLRALAGEAVEDCVEIHFGPGAGRIFETRYTPLRDERGHVTGLIGVATDITTRKQAEEKLQYLAYHDPLTGLPNRLLLDDRLKIALSRARRHGETLALLLIDLDRFKAINDSWGHGIGDKVIKEAAYRIKRRLREEDTVARLGGDEFVLVLPQVGKAENVVRIVERIREELKPAFRLIGQEVCLTASVGIAIYPDDGKDPEVLFKKADAALYRAKEEGRNAFRFHTPSMNEAALGRFVLENQLSEALHQNEFVVHYQPQIEIATGRIVGMEALLRWEHPDLGLVPPVEFVPLAEETGLIVQIGEWVLREACTQNKIWQVEGLPPLKVAVNVSARQLQRPNFPEKVSWILRSTKLDPRCLELEIAEGTVLQKVEEVRELFQRLEKTGARIAIDDFGTGYSSLDYLKKLSLQTLKLDQSLVRDLPDNPRDAAVASAIIALAHSLNIKVLAEGVETQEQLEFLRRRDCDLVQGYLFSKPLPGPEFKKFFKAF
jgi:polar amino acid transport system substrate-binding protein